MRLRNPGTTQAAIDAAGQMLRMLQSARNEANVTGDKRDGFLAWCDNYTRPQMHSLFAPTEELLAELDASHDRVMLAPHLSVRHLNSLLNREFTAWDDRLTRLVAELKQQHKIASRPGKPVVLDSSVLMESSPFFIEVRWNDADPSLAGAQVRLIVPILVVGELDDLLHDRNGDRRLKARNATRALRDLHHARPTEPTALPSQPGVTIEVLLDGDWHQRRPNNDAEIIDQALSVGEMTGKATFLATCDTRQLYRAGAACLQAIVMPRAARPDDQPGRPDVAGSGSAQLIMASSPAPRCRRRPVESGPKKTPARRVWATSTGASPVVANRTIPRIRHSTAVSCRVISVSSSLACAPG